LLGIADPRRLVFAFNGTDALHLAIQGLVRPGDHVVTTVVEHNSVLRPLRQLQDKRGVAVAHVECDERGVVSPQAVLDAVSSRTSFVVVAHASNVTGAIQPVAEIAAALRKFSPNVEASAREPGVFWIDASGLGLLYKSVGGWARAVRAALREAGVYASVVAGFTRFGTFAIARERLRAVTVLRDRATEVEAANRVPLDRLELDPSLRDTLNKLGVLTVGAFLRLPAGGLLQRFGHDAFWLHELASGDRWDPLQPRCAPEAIEQRVVLDDPETDVTRLLFLIKRAADPLLDRQTFERRAPTPVRLLDPRMVPLGTRLVGGGVLPPTGELDWRALHEQYGASGWLAFSAALVTADGLDGLIYYVSECGGICGESGYAWVRRDSFQAPWILVRKLGIIWA
jgi:hypothetical protein